jgi:hypothetical protein
MNTKPILPQKIPRNKTEKYHPSPLPLPLPHRNLQLRLNPTSLQTLCASTDNPGPDLWHLGLEGPDVHVVAAHAGADDVGGHLREAAHYVVGPAVVAAERADEEGFFAAWMGWEVSGVAWCVYVRGWDGVVL